MPRYRSTSPFEQVLLGLSVGQQDVAVFPAGGRPDPVPGSTVVLGCGDEIETADEIAFPGALRLDQPTTPPDPGIGPTPTPVPGQPEETPKP